MSDYFPIVIQPAELASINSSVPPSPEKPASPIEPKEFKTLIFGTLCFLLSVLTIVIMLFTDTIDGSGVFIPAILLVSFILYRIEIYINLSSQKNYDKRVIDYNLDLEKQKHLLAEYDELVKKNLNPETVKSYRNTESIKVFKKALHLIKSDHNSKKGVSEVEFLKLLSEKFKNDVHSDKAIGYDTSDIELQYQPDILLIEPKTMLHVDIEIDEPYTLLDNKPIHYLNNTKDLNRNKFFQVNGWLVIRFAEEQIIKYPYECCGFIAGIVADITGNQEYKKIAVTSSKLKRIKVWSKEEAIKMSHINFRGSYLNVATKPKANKSLEEELTENGFNTTGVHRSLTAKRAILLMEIYKRHGIKPFEPY